MKILTTLILTLIVSGFAEAKESSLCAKFLSHEEVSATADLTERFTAYLAVLWENRVLTLDDLEKFTKVLEEKNKVAHPFSESVKYQSDRSMHAEAIQEYLNYPEKLNKNKILLWAKKILAEQQKTIEEKSISTGATKVAGMKMKFIPLDFTNLHQPKGDKLSHSIEVMQTLVTQRMWEAEMNGHNPSYFYKSNGDYPVENITIWSAMVFANKISIKAGLKPFYDFGDVEMEGSAEQGTLMPKKRKVDEGHNSEMEKLVSLLTVKNKNYLNSEGYRLPLFEEYKVMYLDYESKTRHLEDVVWSMRTRKHEGPCEVDFSPKGNVPVDSNKILGTMGNLSIWTSYVYLSAPVVGGKMILTTAVGIHWAYDVKKEEGFPQFMSVLRDNKTGLRLVRTLKKPTEADSHP